MVLKSSSAQITSPKQPASTGRREKFSSGQSGPGLSSLYLVTGWALCSLSAAPVLCLFPLHPTLAALVMPRMPELLCVHLLTD